jgi:hypothetical protein
MNFIAQHIIAQCVLSQNTKSNMPDVAGPSFLATGANVKS